MMIVAPSGNGSACLHNRIPGMNHPHFLNLKIFLLQNVMGLVDHLLPGHQVLFPFSSHAFSSSFHKYASPRRVRLSGLFLLLLLFDIL